MKDTAISYDLVHHHHQQPQQHSWNHQRQQQLQTHTTSIYSNHHQHLHQSAQPNSHSRQQQQQTQQHDAQLGQYSHQQMQSAAVVAAAAAHHNNAAAYYQQAAHLYPTYHTQQDQQQQQIVSDHHAHHHHPTTVSASSSAATSALNAAVVAAVQQHAGGGNQASALNHHTGWSQAGVGGMASAATPAHHAVVTDHSTLAYMTHAYQSHGSSAVNDHHRNSAGPLANQPIGTAAQTSTYTVDTLYSTPAAAAAVAAAYGYNDYNAAFFQTSNNGPHAQTGHPSPAGLSNFWNQTTQHQQPRNAHSQTVSSQTAPLQQRQHQLSSEQSTNNYLHDPRLYAYNRSAYSQNEAQNFGMHHQQQQSELQHQHQHPHQHQHHRMSANLSHQHSLVQQNQSDQQQVNSPQVGQQSMNHPTSTLSTQQSSSLVSGQQHSDNENRKAQSTIRVSPQHQQVQKHHINSDQTKTKIDVDIRSTHQQNPQQKTAPISQQLNVTDDKADAKLDSQTLKDQKQQQSSNQSPSTNSSTTNKSQSVIKAEPQPAQFQPQTSINHSQSSIQQIAQGTRNIYRAPQEDRVKSQTIDGPGKKFIGEQRDPRSLRDHDNNSKPSHASTIANNRQQEVTSEQASTLEDSLATLSISSRKTTWASIASQPAKVSQPKSLKSKITGSNSVLSSTNKHLTTSVTIDSSSLDSKNGINPAIKNSVSTAATSISRGSAPPPVSKVVSAAAASLKLDLLGEDSLDSKISWPAVNASINLTLEDTLPQKPTTIDNQQTSSSNSSDMLRRDDGYKSRDIGRELRDHNHNQGMNSKFTGMHQQRDDHRHDDWHRRDPREFRTGRDSDRRGDDLDKRSTGQQEDLRDHLNARRNFKQPPGRVPPAHFRQDEPSFRHRDFKRSGPLQDRDDHRDNEDFRYQPPGRAGFDHNRDLPSHANQPVSSANRQQQNDTSSHHHYNNLKEGNHLRNQKPASKLDLLVNPHLKPENFNPENFNLEPENARYFIIKSYSEDDIHRSVKYSVWCSTQRGNERLDEAYRQQQAIKGQLFLFFSVNGSGHFCGMAQMTSNVDFDSSSNIWSQSKWQGQFNVKWIYVKDVPNNALRHITLENNENKPVTNSRDTQEMPSEKGKAVLKIIHQYPHKTSLFDDFPHYEQRQEEERAKKTSQLNHHPPGPPLSRDYDRGDRLGGGGANRGAIGSGGGRFGRPYMNSRPPNNFQNRDRQARFA